MNNEIYAVTEEEVDITTYMQQQCVDSYLTVASSLKSGMSERAIEKAMKAELALGGLKEFWYNIPVMVLVGEDRFRMMAADDYDIKEPQEEIVLQPGMPFFIDMHPRHAQTGRWGNFAATGIFNPQDSEEAIKLLQEMQEIQLNGISSLRADMAGADVAAMFDGKFGEAGIQLLDVRGNYGHSMGTGPKGSFQRAFLDANNAFSIGGQIFGIEPGGTRGLSVARFEDCVHIPDGSLEGQSTILGRTKPVPLVFGNS